MPKICMKIWSIVQSKDNVQIYVQNITPSGLVNQKCWIICGVIIKLVIIKLVIIKCSYVFKLFCFINPLLLK